MRGRVYVISRQRMMAVHLPLISQRSGPLTASPQGEAFSPIDTAFPSAYNETN